MAVAMLSFASCSDDDFLYQDQARVRLVGPKNYTSGTDSLNFSFATYTEETTEMSMDIDVCVMGPVADHDRTANVAIDESLSTATSDLYVLPTSVVIKAGESKGILPITMKRAALLQEKSVKLYIKVKHPMTSHRVSTRKTISSSSGTIWYRSLPTGMTWRSSLASTAPPSTAL